MRGLSAPNPGLHAESPAYSASNGADPVPNSDPAGPGFLDTIAMAQESWEPVVAVAGSNPSSPLRTIVLNRPKALHALTYTMIHKLTDYLRLFEGEPNAKCVLLRATPSKAFCAGGDIKIIAQSANDLRAGREALATATSADGRPDSVGLDGDVDLTNPALMFFRAEYQLNYLIATARTPVVAIMDGVTIGGGIGLAGHSLFRVGTERTLYAMPETAIGFFPDVGGTYLLARMPGGIGMRLGLSGLRLKGPGSLLESGAVTHYVPSEKIPSLVEALATSDLQGPDSVRKVLDAFHMPGPGGSADPASDGPGRAVIDEVYGQPTLSGILESLEHLAAAGTPASTAQWARGEHAILTRMAPTSLAVTFRLIRMMQHYLTAASQPGKRGEIGYADALRLAFNREYVAARQFMIDPDFVEGVRALLIEKDNKPKWDPPILDLLTEKHTASYFRILPGILALHLQDF